MLTMTLLTMALLVCFVNSVSQSQTWGFRILWSLCLCYVIFACIQGYAGPINTVLSLPQWQPLSRMSFTAILIHSLVIVVNEINRRNGQFFSKLVLVRIVTLIISKTYSLHRNIEMSRSSFFLRIAKSKVHQTFLQQYIFL